MPLFADAKRLYRVINAVAEDLCDTYPCGGMGTVWNVLHNYSSVGPMWKWNGAKNCSS
jgi:hypothetical protein